MIPAIGAKAPDFDLVTDSGDRFRLSKEKGHPVVLYFYPEDDTGGCTIENLEFTAQMPEFLKLGVTVLGISPDSVEKHCAFRDKYKLAVPLAADPEHQAIAAYGLWQLKKMFGVEFMGLKRTSFLIAADGTIAGVYPATRIKGHAEKVLAAAQALVTATGKKASKGKKS